MAQRGVRKPKRTRGIFAYKSHLQGMLEFKRGKVVIHMGLGEGEATLVQLRGLEL